MKKTPPTIELLKPSELTVEKDFNPRQTQTFKENVKDVSASIKARGFIDPSIHVVQYIERDGKKLVRGGHTLLEAAKSLGIKEVPACRTELDPLSEQLNLITSNATHPLTRYEKGLVFVRLRDGQLKDGIKWDEGGKVKEGKVVRPPKADDYYRAPMKGSEIAAAIGVSVEYVSASMIISEADEQVSQKLLDGKINANGVRDALRSVPSVEKQVRIINAAIAHAKEDGRESANEKDVKAVKDQFMEKKQVAAPVTTTTETTSANKDTVKETKTSKPGSTAVETPPPDLFKEGGEQPPEGETLHPHDTHGKEIDPVKVALFDGKIPEGKADLVKRLIGVLEDAQEMPHIAIAMTAEEMEILAVAIVKTLETPI